MRHLMRRSVVHACPQIADFAYAGARRLVPSEGMRWWSWSCGGAAGRSSATCCAANGASEDRQRERHESACCDESAFELLCHDACLTNPVQARPLMPGSA